MGERDRELHKGELMYVCGVMLMSSGGWAGLSEVYGRVRVGIL
jgi:hypothetical protein